MTAFSFFSKDILPVEGGYLQQPNKWLEAVMYLQHLQNKAERNRLKKDKERKPYALPGKASPATPRKAPIKGFKKGRPAPQKTVRARPVKR